MGKLQDKAWDRGFRAGANGQPDSACPYKQGMVYIAWHQGWRNGVKSQDDKDAWRYRTRPSS